MRAKAIPLLILAALLLPSLVSAQQSSYTGRERPDVISNWAKRLKSADENLQKGEWKKSKKAMNKLLTEMCDSIESGKNAARLLATAAFLRGLAEAGLGNERDAIWDWHIATNLHPDFVTSDFSNYRQAGELFVRLQKEAQERSAREDQQVDPAKGEAHHEEATPRYLSEPNITRPERIRSKAPKYPFAKRVACLEGPVIVQLIIDRQGIPQRPKVLTDLDQPIFAFAALDNFRTWRFKPATLSEKPVEVYYLLTTNFNIATCEAP